MLHAYVYCKRKKWLHVLLLLYTTWVSQIHNNIHNNCHGHCKNIHKEVRRWTISNPSIGLQKPGGFIRKRNRRQSRRSASQCPHERNQQQVFGSCSSFIVLHRSGSQPSTSAQIRPKHITTRVGACLVCHTRLQQAKSRRC